MNGTDYIKAAENNVGKFATSAVLFGEATKLAMLSGNDALTYRFALQAQRAARVEIGLPKHGPVNLR